MLDFALLLHGVYIESWMYLNLVAEYCKSIQKGRELGYRYEVSFRKGSLTYYVWNNGEDRGLNGRKIADANVIFMLQLADCRI